MKKLHFYDTEVSDELAWPESDGAITPDSCALEIFTDFNHHIPLVFEPSIAATDAEQIMRKEHVKLKFVVDEDSHFLGIVSLEDLNSREIIKKLSRGYKRQELSITDFMRPRSELKAFDYEELSNSTIRDVVETLSGSGQRHCLVVDRRLHRICGIISASDIIRKLKLPLDIENRSGFSYVFEAVCLKHCIARSPG